MKLRHWQQLIPQHYISKLINLLSHCRIPFFKRWAIRRYLKKYDVNMREALEKDLEQYENLNAFFTRQILLDQRPMDLATNLICSPADGRIQQLGHCAPAGECLSVKGETYSVLKLLAGQTELAMQFQHASFINIYLAPRDYHRIHIPLDGTLLAMWTVPGSLFAVNPQTVAAMPDLFARNERVCCLFETEFGPMMVVLVGAMIVSGIHLNWAGDLTPSVERKVTHVDYRSQSPVKTFKKGDELGYFKFGSTVIVLMANGQHCQWQPQLKAGEDCLVRQTIGTLTQ